MTKSFRTMRAVPVLLPLAVLGAAGLFVNAQPGVTSVQVEPGGTANVAVTAAAGEIYRLEASADLIGWAGLRTVQSAGAEMHADRAAAGQPRRFYRAVPSTGLTGDHLATSDGEAIIHPVSHASVVVQWNGVTVHVDPSGSASLFTPLPKADVILITHSHGDHFSSSVTASVLSATGVIFAPQVVYNNMSAALKSRTTVMTNGAVQTSRGMNIEAVAMYNLTTTNHVKGAGNGYVLTLGGKRLYFSGDSEDTPEMRALTDIDAAFVAMNLPFTMSVSKAASAVLEFRPKVVYPYHYRNSDNSLADVNQFRQLVGADPAIEVRLRPWY